MEYNAVDYDGMLSANDTTFTTLRAEGGDAYLINITGEVGFYRFGSMGRIKVIKVDSKGTMVESDFARSHLFVTIRGTGKIPKDFIVDVTVCPVLMVATQEGWCMWIFHPVRVVAQ